MKFVIVMFALTLSVFAQEKESEGLKTVMKSFASAMEQIQHGILYNNIDEMKMGVKKLSVEDGKFLESHGEALMRHMPEKPEFVKNYTHVFILLDDAEIQEGFSAEEALNFYNGRGCIKGWGKYDSDYALDVLRHKAFIERMFPECA